MVKWQKQKREKRSRRIREVLCRNKKQLRAKILHFGSCFGASETGAPS